MEEIIETLGEVFLHIIPASVLLKFLFQMLNEGGIINQMTVAFLNSICG